MSFNKKTIEDVQVNGKRVLVRCDFNVPLKDGVITDENRLVGALPTIKYLVENGAKVVLCSHLGKDASKTLAPTLAVRSFTTSSIWTTNQKKRENQAGQVPSVPER